MHVGAVFAAPDGHSRVHARARPRRDSGPLLRRAKHGFDKALRKSVLTADECSLRNRDLHCGDQRLRRLGTGAPAEQGCVPLHRPSIVPRPHDLMHGRVRKGLVDAGAEPRQDDHRGQHHGELLAVARKRHFH